MSTLSIDEKGILQEEEIFYFNTFFTMLTFIGSLWNCLFFGYMVYYTRANSKWLFCAIILVGFIFVLLFFIKAANAFKRLLLHQPAMKISKNKLYDYWNNKEINWVNVAGISTSYRWWDVINVMDFSYWIINGQSDKTASYYTRVVNKFLSKRRLKIGISILEGNNTDIADSIKRYSKTA